MDNYQREYLKRKAKRILYQARNASFVKSLKHPSGRTLQVFTAERSRGFQTNYERKPIFYLLVYENGELITGQTMTKTQWLKYEPQFMAVCHTS